MQNSLLIHKHLIIRAEVNNPPKDVEKLTEWLKEFISFIDMKIMMGPYVAYCNKKGNAEFDPYKIAEKIAKDFEVVKLDYKFLNRETGLKPIRLKKPKNDHNNLQVSYRISNDILS